MLWYEIGGGDGQHKFINELVKRESHYMDRSKVDSIMELDILSGGTILWRRRHTRCWGGRRDYNCFS